MSEVRIYVEGGGDSNDGRAEVRRGFRGFLSELVELARIRRIRFTIVPCGGRSSTYDDFCNALKHHPEAWNVLLVDAEGPVSQPPWQHLLERDKFAKPESTSDDNCHLMVQLMEAWLITDVATLEEYYGQGFNANRIPKSPNVEEVPKQTVEEALSTSTKNTQKGRYHKIRHGPDLLSKVNPTLVRKASRHCQRLFDIIRGRVSETAPGQ